MEDASSYKLHNILRDKDLRRFTLVLGLYCFDPCSSREMGAGDSSLGESVEFVVDDLFDNCRESSTNRPPFLQNKANLPAGQNPRKRSFDKELRGKITLCEPTKTNPNKANFRQSQC
jgi:hypothetical protein